MFVTQLLAPDLRRIFVPVEGRTHRLIDDPALGDWARAQLAGCERVTHATLGDALAAVDAVGCIDEVHRGDDGSLRISGPLTPGEALYGAYDADAAGLNRRGQHVHLVNEIHPRGQHLMTHECDLCSSHDAPPMIGSDGLDIGDDSNYGEMLIPLVMSNRGWGVYVSSARHDAVLDLGHRDPARWSWSADGGDLDVYLLGAGAGASLSELLGAYTRLTGTQSLPPAWALGFVQSRFGYESFDHAHEVLDRFERERLPVHAMVFDVQWLDEHVNLKWHPVDFPDPAGNLARMAERGVRTLVITEPGTRRDADNYPSGAEIEAFATTRDGDKFDSQQWYVRRGIEQYRDIEPGSGALVNFFAEHAADWWYAQHLALAKLGVDAWWLDLNEPEDVRADVVHFPDTDWPVSHTNELSGRDARSWLAIAQQRAFARRDQRHTNRRPFALTRAASAGSQRYGAAPWSGDVASTWLDMQVQPRLALTAGLCGMPLWGCDVGGFGGDPGPELFVRWMQLGSVLPIFRAHGYMADREPWSQGSAALAAIRPSLVLRAQLLPSIVTWARQALEQGMPLVRAMLLGPHGCDAQVEAAHAADARFVDCHDQWYFGPILVAPVLEQGASSRRVHLPEGEWIDLWSGAAHRGPATIDVPVSLSSLPMFVTRDTALIVDADPLARRGTHWPPEECEVWSWAADDGATACGELYVDDGCTRDYAQGAWALQRVRVTGGSVETELAEHGDGTAPVTVPVRVAVPKPGAVRPR